MKSETMSDVELASIVIAKPLGELAISTPDDAIDLKSCSELEWIAVRTRSSVYDIIVLSGEIGEVMIRGGRFFSEYRRAIMAGSIFGRSGVKLRSICVGLHLEFHFEGKSFVTSRIQAVSRHRLTCRGRTSVAFSTFRSPPRVDVAAISPFERQRRPMALDLGVTAFLGFWLAPRRSHLRPCDSRALRIGQALARCAGLVYCGAVDVGHDCCPYLVSETSTASVRS